VNIWIKREDYASDLYGGNKVRGLEFLLGCAAACIEKEKKGVCFNFKAAGLFSDVEGVVVYN
jgi:hypothetical protein